MKLSQAFFSCLLILIWAIPIPAESAELCRAIDFIDGDTVIVKCEKYDGLLDLRGIDAPELEQPHGLDALLRTKELLENKDLILIKLDRTMMAGVLLEQGGKNINARLVREGFAWSIDRKHTEDNYMLKAEVNARAYLLGLWGEYEIQPPWEYRVTQNIKDD